MNAPRAIRLALSIGVMMTLLFAAPHAAAADAEFMFPAGERQLFLDDAGIAEMKNLERTMHQPAKKGAVIRPDLALGEGNVQGRTAPAWDPEKKLFKFWNLYGPPGMTHAAGYYESKDGLHWYKPVVGQLKYRGSFQNNYMTVKIAGGRMVRPSRVVYDASDPDPARRFKTFLPNAGVAVSPDGIRWKHLAGIPKVPSGDESNFSFDDKAHLFIATVKHGGPYGRSVHLSTSKDFRKWTKTKLIFHADKLDQELGRKNIKARLADPTLQQSYYKANPRVYRVDVYNMGLFRYEGLYIGMPAMFHSTSPVLNYPNTDGFHLVQAICSRDLQTWKRVGNRRPFIGPSRLGSGAYDLTQIMPPSAPVVRGDELWFYYWGGKYRGTFRWEGKYPKGKMIMLPGFDPDGGAICLGVLRRDGFISLDAAEEGGTVLTNPLKLPGDKLFVNVDALTGELLVEVLNKNGEVLAASAPIKDGDHRQIEVKWQKGNIADVQGQAVSLRFSLREARFYSYWLE